MGNLLRDFPRHQIGVKKGRGNTRWVQSVMHPIEWQEKLAFSKDWNFNLLKNKRLN